MGETTKISWCDHTFNPWIGCTEAGPGCDLCYAREMAKRYGWAGWGNDAPRHRTAASTWKQPYKWERAALKDNTSPRVFGGSLMDWADNRVPPEWRADYLRLIADTPHLQWMLLTKRSGNIEKLMTEAVRAAGLARMPRNIAFGGTFCNQQEIDRDLHKLLLAAIELRPLFTFVSLEPLLGPIVLPPSDLPYIDEVIVGGESGTGARHPEEEWVRSLRDQVFATSGSTAFHFKQWGAMRDGNELDGRIYEQRAMRELA